MNIKEEINDLARTGILRPELRMGIISSVKAHIAYVNLHCAGDPSGTYFEGRRYGKGEVGEFVLIEGQQNILLGRIIEVRLPEAERKTVGLENIGDSELDAIGYIQLLGSISMANFRFTAGVDIYPRLGDRVYSAPHRFIALIPSLMTNSEDDNTVVNLEVGAVDVTNESKVRITPEKLLGRHCAILGATGGGKSWTTSRIIEECIRYKTKIILLDATGEYRNFRGTEVMHCHLGEPVHKAGESINCSFPPTCFQESDFIALFEPAGKVQGPKLRAAIRSLRLAKLKPELAPEGFIRKIEQPKKNVIEAEREPGISEKLDDPRQPFEVKYLVAQIEQECVWPDAYTKNGKDTTKWGGPDGNFSHCLSLVARINGVLTSQAFSCVFHSDDPPITEKIDLFLRDKEKRLLRICLGGIVHEFKAREIIANALGRYFLNKARSGIFLNQPLIIFVDEAHSFLGRSIGGEDTVARLDAFELIAKEGRKFGLNICLATQRPRDITEGVLSQMGTLVVHRLTNERDQEIVEKACGEIDRSASSFLPNLQPGEAAIIGVDFPIPLTIRINKPTFRPISDGPNYQKHWKIE